MILRSENNLLIVTLSAGQDIDAIFFIGCCIAKTFRMLKFLNVACTTERSFYRHTSFYIYPVIIRQWKEHQQHLLNRLAETEDGLVLAGDGRCDSPGYCAKFGSFTIMEQQLNRVVDFQLVQVG